MANVVFSPEAAHNLAKALKQVDNELEQKAVEMANMLSSMHEYYKDCGYDEHNTNILAALKAVKAVSADIDEMAAAITAYADSMMDI